MEDKVILGISGVCTINGDEKVVKVTDVRELKSEPKKPSEQELKIKRMKSLAKDYMKIK